MELWKLVSKYCVVPSVFFGFKDTPTFVCSTPVHDWYFWDSRAWNRAELRSSLFGSFPQTWAGVLCCELPKCAVLLAPWAGDLINGDHGSVGVSVFLQFGLFIFLLHRHLICVLLCRYVVYSCLCFCLRVNARNLLYYVYNRIIWYICVCLYVNRKNLAASENCANAGPLITESSVRLVRVCLFAPFCPETFRVSTYTHTHTHIWWVHF